MKKLLLLSGAALILSSSLTMASNSQDFNNLDANKDGVITKAEFNNQANKKTDLKNKKVNVFYQMDPDNDDGRNSDQ